MHFLSTASTAISLLSLLPSPVLARTPHAAKYHKAQNERRGNMHAIHQHHQHQQKRATPSYLTNKTAPFAVNGSSLPNVDFDIGESYSGLLPVGNSTTDNLFFWFVPTENPTASDEIVIWLNGGPGCSSLDGFLHENGPVVWQPGQYAPVKNPYTWANLSNVVWIDQPVGTGYSSGTPTAANEDDVAAQFLEFWKGFMKTFALEGRKVYVTGESYAGMYAPYIASAMINKNDTTYFDVQGLMIYDPSIGYDTITEQVPVKSFVEWNHNVFPFNDTLRAQISDMSASCGYDDFMEQAMTFPPKGPLPPPPSGDNCDIFDLVSDSISEINPCFDIYQVGQICPILWDVLGFPYSSFYLPVGYENPYFNMTAVKEALHVPTNQTWEICSSGAVFVGDGDTSLPSGLTGGPLQNVIEHTNNVIVGHGTLDMVLIANGSLATLQNLTWNGAQGFTKYPSKPFYVPYHEDLDQSSVAGAGVFGSWQTDRGLTLVFVELSGHMIPEFAPSAAYRHLEFLLGRIEDLSEVSSFTTQNFTQPSNPLGNGTAWVKRDKCFGCAGNEDIDDISE